MGLFGVVLVGGLGIGLGVVGPEFFNLGEHFFRVNMKPGFEARALEFGAGFADFFRVGIQWEQGHRKPSADALAR